MNAKNDVNEIRPIRRRRPPPSPATSGRSHPETKVQPYPFQEHHTEAALAHCELSTSPGDERLDCPLKALARLLIITVGEWISDIREDEAVTVQSVFGLKIEWHATTGARWTGFWTVPLPGGWELQEEVKAFEQFLVSRPEPKVMNVAANSIRRVAGLISDYVADMAAHAAGPAPWNGPDARPAREVDVRLHP